MEKTLVIDGRQVGFKSTGAFLLRYKAQFGRDAIADIAKLEMAYNPKTKKIINTNAIDMEVFYNLIWTLAKTSDQTIPPPMEWLDTFSSFPLNDILPQLIDMIFSSFKTSKKK